jgi:transcriptional regulator with XRE-family HTH domain
MCYFVGMSGIGARLRRARENAGLTLGQVAEYEGISPQYLHKLEKEINRPNVWALLVRLAKRYGVSADQLLGIDATNASGDIGLADDLHILEDSLERLTEYPGEDFAEELIEFMQLASDSDIIALTAFVRALKEVKQSRQKT